MDHDFCDALDALMVLDIEAVPEQKMQMLVRELDEEVVASRLAAMQKNA